MIKRRSTTRQINQKSSPETQAIKQLRHERFKSTRSSAAVSHHRKLTIYGINVNRNNDKKLKTGAVSHQTKLGKNGGNPHKVTATSKGVNTGTGTFGSFFTK